TFLQFRERIRLQQTRLMHDIELPIRTRTSDACMFPGMMIRGVDLDIALGSRERKIRGCRDHFLHVQAFGFFDRELPEIYARVTTFHRITHDAILAIFRLDGLNEFFIRRVLLALEITHAGVITDRVLLADAVDLVFGNHGREQRLFIAGKASCLQLLEECDVATAYDGAVYAIRLRCLDLVDNRRELSMAKRSVFFTERLAAYARDCGFGDFVAGTRVDIVGPHQEE